MDNLHKIKSQAYLTIHCQGIKIQTVLNVPNLIYGVILGSDTSAKIKAVIDFENNKLTCSIHKTMHNIKLGISSKESNDENDECFKLIKPTIHFSHVK